MLALVLSVQIWVQSILHEGTLLLGVQAYLAGLTFALAASPCSTPVLATLLGYVAASKVLPINNLLVLIFLSGNIFYAGLEKELGSNQTCVICSVVLANQLKNSQRGLIYQITFVSKF